MTTFFARIDQARSAHFGDVKHVHATLDGKILEVEQPVALRIEADEIGYFLFRLSELGDSVADTWHLTLDEAQSQAEFEYSVAAVDWVRVD